MNRIQCNLIAVTAAAALLGPATGLAQGDARAFQFQLGLTLVSGMGDLEDQIVANNPAFRAITISPIGLSASFLYRVAENWRVAASIGPVVAGTGDASFTIVPVGLSIRYDFARGDGGSGPFVRLGVEQAIANGDFVETGNAGGVAALGYDFGDARRGGWGLELAHRSAKVDVPGITPARNKTAQPYKASLTVYWAF